MLVKSWFKPFCFCLCFLFFVASITYGQNLTSGGMHPDAQINFVKKQLKNKKQPYLNAYQLLIAKADSALTIKNHALEDFSIPGYYSDKLGHRRNSLALQVDGFSAYSCALAYRLNGKKKYLEKAIYFLNAWARINKKYSQLDGSLVMSYSGTTLMIAADLIKNENLWKSSDQDLFKAWTRNVFREAANSIRFRNNNSGDWSRFASLLADIYLEDQQDFQTNLSMIKADLWTKIAADGHMIEEVKRQAKGIWYTYFSLAPITASAWVIYTQTGEDLFSANHNGRSLKKALDYLLYHHEKPSEWRFNDKPETNSNYTETGPWPANLFEAMNGIYPNAQFNDFASPHRPIMYPKHDYAWTFPTLMPLSLSGYTEQQSSTKADEILKITRRVADWQANSWLKEGFKHRKADWTNGACYTGFFAFGNIKGNEGYHDLLIDIGNELGWNTGKHRFYADDYCVAQTYAQLYQKYKQRKMIKPFQLLADSILAAPHEEPLHWKNNIQYREWAWCDALFMAPPSLAYLASASGKQKYLDLACKLWWKTSDYLYDPAEQLYFRDGSYLNKKEKNGEKVFWSRGNGWVLAGLVRVLENMPKQHPDRARFVRLYKDMVAKIASLQQSDGSWHASLLDPQSYPIKEMSGTGFFCYAMAWGLNQKLLEQDLYLPVVNRAWKTMTQSVQLDGKLGYVQPIGASPDKVDANSTEVYGVGAFLLAGTELYKFEKKNFGDFSRPK